MTRFERLPESERKREKLTDRHTAIIEHVFTARYMTIRMLNRLCFLPSEWSWTKEHVRNLFHWGFLKKRDVGLTSPDILFVGLKGRRYLAQLGQFTKDEIDKIAGVPGGGEPPMPHDLTLSHLYVSAVLQCRALGYEYRWKNTRMLELAELGVQPDAYLSVAGKVATREAFIEFTDVVPSKDEMNGKLEGYRKLWERTQPLPILWFTTSPYKVPQLRRMISSFVYRDYILIGLVDDAIKFITGKVWVWGEGEQLVNWITPPQQVLYDASAAREQGV